MAMLAAVPLLSLILIRMLWSGSALWFLTVGILLLLAAAVMYLMRRPHDDEPAFGGALMDESSKAPIILAGLGVLFLALLALPNFAADSGSDPLAQRRADNSSEVAGTTSQNQSQQPAPQQPAQQQPARPSGQGETYVIQAGDTLWDIALRFDTTVEAIVDANGLANAEDLQVGQEIQIPEAAAAPAAP
jgi:LysM repeat protein